MLKVIPRRKEFVVADLEKLVLKLEEENAYLNARVSELEQRLYDLEAMREQEAINDSYAEHH